MNVLQRYQSQLQWLGAIVLLYLAIIGLRSVGIIGAYHMNNIILAGIYVILAVSLNLINGFTGQFSIGHAGFMGVGAYFGAICTIKFGLPLIVALLVGGAVAAIAGVLIGLPTLRLRGDYLAIATLGFGEILRVVFLNWDYVGGARGFMGIPRYTNFTWVYVIAVLTVVVIRNWVQSAHGRACIAIREDEIAASAMGINTTFYKVIAFTVGAFFAGLAGVLYAHFFYLVLPNTFNFLMSIEILIMVVLGGLGSITGSVLAAIGLTALTMLLSDLSELRMIIYSVALIVIMVYRPSGLMGAREFTFPWLKNKNAGDEESREETQPAS